MKKLLIAGFMILGFAGIASAQQKVEKTTAAKTTEKIKVVTKDGKNAKVVKMKTTTAVSPIKADGTPDMRFKANKEKAKATPVAGPTKKDGTADMRYKANKKKS